MINNDLYSTAIRLKNLRRPEMPSLPAWSDLARRRAIEKAHKKLQEEYDETYAHENAKRMGLYHCCERLIDQQEKTMNTLIEIYDKNVIRIDYRTITMVCALYEYLSDGRCTQLEGIRGGYILLENALLDDGFKEHFHIINDTPVDPQKQPTVFRIVKAVNEKARALLNPIKITSLLSNYCSEQQEKESAYLHRIQQLAL